MSTRTPAKTAAKPAAKKASVKKAAASKKAVPAKKPAKAVRKPAPKTYPPVSKDTLAIAAVPDAADAQAKAPKLKQKLVRDSFTMPRADFDLVAALKERLLSLRVFAKKSELLRAGLHALTAQSDAQLSATLKALTPLKPGRPKTQD
jgi:hypothetical protein